MSNEEDTPEEALLRKKIHKCHAPNCEEQCEPSYFTCSKHWYDIPKGHRKLIKKFYKKNQEVTKKPSRKYVEAARAAINALKEKEVTDMEKVQVNGSMYYRSHTQPRVIIAYNNFEGNQEALYVDGKLVKTDGVTFIDVCKAVGVTVEMVEIDNEGFPDEAEKLNVTKTRTE